MSGRKTEDKSGNRGGTTWNDGLHSVDGGGLGTVSSIFPEAQGFSSVFGSSIGEGTAAFESTPRPAVKEIFAPVDNGCKDGVCPVPWATVDAGANKENFITSKGDQVNHPSHYTDGSIECIEAIEAALTPEEFRGYCKGNIIKYSWRERIKDGTVSLKKAQWYLDRLIQNDEIQKG